MSASIDYTYQYAFESGIKQAGNTKPALTLATCNPDQSSPYFFDGRMRSPRLMGDLLIVLTDVVRAHFFLPRPVLLDPVLTSSEKLLRLEGFSGCCGVYARVDLPAEAFDGSFHGRGTTNVDFNTPMRNALMRLRDHEDVRFSVGKDEVVLSKSDESTIEKKVKLPLRWVKGFSEVQAYLPRLELKMETKAADALRLVRSFAKTSKPKQASYVVRSGGSLRLSQRQQRGAIKITGTHRVKVIEPLLTRATGLRIWANEENGTSAWEVLFKSGSFFLMISPEVYRGFSGEGQVLSSLAKPPSETLLSQVRAQLKWQAEIHCGDLADSLHADRPEIELSLAVLGSRGLAGFDVSSGRYVHRELPFDLEQVEAMQPRLKNARKLLDQGELRRLHNDSDNQVVYQIPGSGTHHRVVLGSDQDRCTCPWFSKYLGQRGPCKHILAAQLAEDSNQ